MDEFGEWQSLITKVFNDGVHVGWEIRCLHPAHQEFKQKRNKCRKNLRMEARGRTAEQTLRMLKTWIAWGASATSWKVHQTDVWERVEKAAAAGTLPESVESPTTFRPEAAEAFEALGRKRKRGGQAAAAAGAGASGAKPKPSRRAGAKG